jgi:hypothetical protein
MTSKGRIAVALAAATACAALSACAPTTRASRQAAAANPITSGPQIGRCDGTGCSWFDIRSFAVVRETGDGALIRTNIREGSSVSRGDRPHPTSSRGVKIDWTGEATDQFVFCSTKLPAMITGSAGAYEATRLNLIQWGVPSEYNLRVYSHVCHHGENILAEGAAQRAGYRSTDDHAPVISLTRPEAIFDHIGH